MWRELLDDPETLTLPWFGQGVRSASRVWRTRGPRPPEHGWYGFQPSGRFVTLVGPRDPCPDYLEGFPAAHGYVVGDRLIPEDARVTVDPGRFVEQSKALYCPDLTLERFTRGVAAKTPEGLVYCGQGFDLGAEAAVRDAYEDRADSVATIPGVTPALDLAFRWSTVQREAAEQRRRDAEERRRLAEEQQAREGRIQQAMREAGTAVGRRALAAHDFEAAAREALRVSGAELLDVRELGAEVVVRYRFRERRFECVVDRQLNILDAGVCLTDERTGVKGDTWFTLESLPGTVGQAMDEGKLLVWRHG